MSREQLFICAMETREKQLLAQELYKRNGRCDAVRYEEGAIIIENETGNGIDNGNYSGIDENGNMKDLIAIQGKPHPHTHPHTQPPYLSFSLLK